VNDEREHRTLLSSHDSKEDAVHMRDYYAELLRRLRMTKLYGVRVDLISGTGTYGVWLYSYRKDKVDGD
jgi:hypothetical protein